MFERVPGDSFAGHHENGPIHMLAEFCEGVDSHCVWERTQAAKDSTVLVEYVQAQIVGMFPIADAD